MRRLLLPVLALAACGDDVVDPYEGLVQVSAASPFDDGCALADGDEFRGAEVEPHVAVDPSDPDHLVGAWQQDRRNGGANGLGAAVSRDGGATWTTSILPFTSCAGGADYERASDPWVSIAPDGTVWAIGIAFDRTRSAASSVIATRSTDGGETWDDPVDLIRDEDVTVFNDKEAITADPNDASRVYAVWDRLYGVDPDFPDTTGTGPTLFARAVDGVWEAPVVAWDAPELSQTVGNILVVLPDGTLVIAFERIDGTDQPDPAESIAVIRSTDGGDTWSEPIALVQFQAVGVFDEDRNVGVRSGALPSIAVDASSGALYLVWQDARFSNELRDGIAISRSTDGGLTWSPPTQLNGAPDVPAFTPAVAVAADGTVGVTYYDLRDSAPGAFDATVWLATSTDGGETFTDEPLTQPFDLRTARLGPYYFLGDYQGLAAAGDDLVPFFTAPTGGDTGPIDVFVRPRPL